jgi:hypothetical protein
MSDPKKCKVCHFFRERQEYIGVCVKGVSDETDVSDVPVCRAVVFRVWNRNVRLVSRGSSCEDFFPIPPAPTAPEDPE